MDFEVFWCKIKLRVYLLCLFCFQHTFVETKATKTFSEEKVMFFLLTFLCFPSPTSHVGNPWGYRYRHGKYINMQYWDFRCPHLFFAPKGLLCRAVKKIVFVRAYIRVTTWVTKSARARIGTTFWNTCEGTVKFNCSETDHLGSGEENEKSLTWNLLCETCVPWCWVRSHHWLLCTVLPPQVGAYRKF